MTEFLLTPSVDVAEAEYRRLLGYPPGAELSERAGELAEWARDWYALHGQPWIYARPAASLGLAADALEIEGVSFHAGRLRKALEDAQADAAFVAAVSAGPEAEAEAHRLWREGKPDEYFFLEMFASAVVEHLLMLAGAELCGWADRHSLAVLPHASPGYLQWDVGEQKALLDLIRRGAVGLPGPLEAFDSGALSPKKSQLAVFGMSRHLDRVDRLADLVPCRRCALPNCQYRRMPVPPAYSVNLQALRKWAAERLRLEAGTDGTLVARFRYDGVTCTNMGRPLAFDYEVALGARREGYPIRRQACAPAPGDSGYQSMCRHVAEGPALMSAIDREKPLAGRPLAEVLAWHRAGPAAGCYCEPAAREHKWGLVLETIHYALHHSGSWNLNDDTR